MTSLDSGFSALAHPERRRLLSRLAAGRSRITELGSGAGMTFAAVSKHLRVLESAGFVSRAVNGREHWFALRPGGLDRAQRWIEAQSALWQSRLETLKQLVEDNTRENGMSGERSYMAQAEVQIAAPPEKVFAAWSNAKLAKKFFAAGSLEVMDFEFESRVGGRLLVVMGSAERQYYHRGDVVVADAPRRLVFTWISQGTKLRTSVVSIDFAAEAGGTKLRLVHEGHDAADWAAEHSEGWQSILDKLAKTFA